MQRGSCFLTRTMQNKTPPPILPKDELPDNSPQPDENRSLGVSVWRVASSTWLGVVLLVVLAALYGVLSLIERSQQQGPKSILPSLGGLYSHWTVLVVTFALCVNLLFATVRIPVKWDRAGAWCSHLGLMFLVIGSVYFWRTRIEGQCLIPRSQDGSWPVVNYFFKSTDQAACYVSTSERITPDSAVETRFDSPAGLKPIDMDIPIDGGPPGVSMRISKIYPRAELRQQWLDDSPALVPAVEVQVSHGRDTARTIMCQAYQDTFQFELPEAVVMFQARGAMSQERIDQLNANAPATSQPAREWFIIHYDGRGPAVLVTRNAAGKMARQMFSPGQTASTAGPHPSSIKLVRTMNHARRGVNVEVPPEDMPGQVSAAMDLEITSGSTKLIRAVPYQAYLSGRPTSIRLPSGREFYVMFSHCSEELPEAIRITRHEFKTAPASRMPEDYICDLEIGGGINTRTETLKLNFPVSIGQFRLHQSTWRPKEETPSDYSDPSAIILGVADRPGILLIFVGSIALCMGFPYAFYVKPLILKYKSRRAAS